MSFGEPTRPGAWTPPPGYSSWDEWWAKHGDYMSNFSWGKHGITPTRSQFDTILQQDVIRNKPKGVSEGADNPPKLDPIMDWPDGGGGSFPGTTYASAGQPQLFNSERLLGRLEDMRMGNISQSQYMPYLRRF